MILKKPEDLFALTRGDIVDRENLYDLIQKSKVENSDYWSVAEMTIGNTPQQGINWIGKSPNCHGVIIKTKDGSYENDGWTDESKITFNYSFKARKGKIKYSEKANEVLIKQPQFLYPILLFIEHKDGWLFEDFFSVSAIEDAYVVLKRGLANQFVDLLSSEESQYQEGDRKYVSHLIAERNRSVVKDLKDTQKWICDICSLDFSIQYGVDYIEAHHKIPISTFSAKQTVNISDFALLCPNCHKAVHIYMKTEGLDYDEIKNLLTENLI